MIELKYSLVIEATDDPNFFGFYSPELEGFTGVGHSIEDCLYKAKWGIEEHLALMKEMGLPVPEVNEDCLDIVENPDLVLRGDGGALIAVRGIARRRYLAVVYRELSRIDGFIISAYFISKIPRRSIVWRRH